MSKDDSSRSLLALLGIDRKVISLRAGKDDVFPLRRVSGDDAPAALLRFRNEPGTLPVILGDGADYDRIRAGMDRKVVDAADTIRVGESFDVPAWIAQRIAGAPAFHARALGPDTGTPTPIGASMFASVHEKMGGGPLLEVFIGMIPVGQPWHVPAVLHLGGWGTCPPPEVHVAFFRHWFERYGAVVACVRGEVVEFTVERPPATVNAALALAHEQFVYCPDIVLPGLGSEAALARAMLHARHWYFWWDRKMET